MKLHTSRYTHLKVTHVEIHTHHISTRPKIHMWRIDTRGKVESRHMCCIVCCRNTPDLQCNMYILTPKTLRYSYGMCDISSQRHPSGAGGSGGGGGGGAAAHNRTDHKKQSCKFDSTGMFHWCPSQSMSACLIVSCVHCLSAFIIIIIIIILFFLCFFSLLTHRVRDYYFVCAIGGQHDGHLPFWLPALLNLLC